MIKTSRSRRNPLSRRSAPRVPRPATPRQTTTDLDALFRRLNAAAALTGKL